MLPKGLDHIKLAYGGVYCLTVVIKEMNNQVQYSEEFVLKKVGNVRIT
jgi:hypothetical protein